MAWPRASWHFTASSCARTAAICVLPNPGGPTRRQSSSRLLSSKLASSATRSWSTTPCCPMMWLRELGVRRSGRSAWSSPPYLTTYSLTDLVDRRLPSLTKMSMGGCRSAHRGHFVAFEAGILPQSVSVRPIHGGEREAALPLAGAAISTTCSCASGFGSGFVQPMGENSLWMCRRPAVGQHLVQAGIVGGQAEERFTAVPLPRKSHPPLWRVMRTPNFRNSQ